MRLENRLKVVSAYRPIETTMLPLRVLTLILLPSTGISNLLRAERRFLRPVIGFRPGLRGRSC